MDKLNKVVIFIPAYNEEESIASVIDKVMEIYTEQATRIKGYRVEMLVVNDGSSDRTEEIANSKGVDVVSHPRNLGLGAATRTAMETAFQMGADVAIKLDADFQHDPSDIEKVIMPILENKTDICWGSRFAGKINYRMPLVRHLGNKFFTWVMNRLTNYEISDAQTGLMAYSRKYLKIFELHGDYNPPQQLLMDANYKYMRYMEVPVVFHPRTSGKSFVNFKYPFYVLVNIFRILVYANPLKVFATIGLTFIFFSIFYLVFTLMVEKFGWGLEWLLVDKLSLATLFVGLQCFFFGILADLIIRKIK
jgi:glycosyltransferase involved in cell wall biosynthesis